MTTSQPLEVQSVAQPAADDARSQPDPSQNGVRRFPAGFRWGAATAAYQIEGAAAVDGRTPSIWDTFSETPGRVAGGHTGHIATDHYHRYRDDVALMTRLGLTSYRFSVSWPRVQPAGAGPANPAGLDFYRRLVDELLEHGIEPWLTLYHWDLPQPVEDAGGWPERDTAARFAEYADLMYGALGDRVRHWTTLNEPWCSSFVGYGSGEHAPGRRDAAAAVRAAHHLLLAHGLAVDAIQDAASAGEPAGVEIGITLNLYAITAASAEPADTEAARRYDGLCNRFFLDPVLLGRYPEDVVNDLAAVTDFAHVRDGDLAVISRPVSLLGINYYSRHTVAAPEPEPDGVLNWRAGAQKGSAYPGSEGARIVYRGVPVTAMNWEIDAPGLTEVLLRVNREYPPIPLYVTENGAAFHDEVSADGSVNDPDRRAYFESHLRACHDAIAAGAPLHGYFAWSLLDNFEWGWGYTRRFGLVYVDYLNQTRTPKASAHFYADVIRRHGLLDTAPPGAAATS